MKHIILIGFKNAGKTVIGTGLAEKLGRMFVDLDREIEEKKGATVRDIMQKEGEPTFRKIESETLREVLGNSEALVLALGGGTVVAPENQELLKGQSVVFVSAPKEVLFERIMQAGRPAFFQKDLNDRDAFEKLYREREPVYEKLARITVKNDKTVERAVEEIIKNLSSS